MKDFFAKPFRGNNISKKCFLWQYTSKKNRQRLKKKHNKEITLNNQRKEEIILLFVSQIICFVYNDYKTFILLHFPHICLLKSRKEINSKK